MYYTDGDNRLTDAFFRTTLVLQQNRLRWYGHVLRKEDILDEEMYGI